MQNSSDPLKQLCAAIELSRLPSVGAAKFKALIDRYGSPVEVLHWLPRQIDLIDVKHKAVLTHQQFNDVLNLPESISFTYYGAVDYPRLLAKLSEPPPYLFRKGKFWPLSTPMIAIVGPRGCSAAGAQFARDIATGLAEHGAVVVSGGALGIDTAAHQGALAGGGFSVLVTATGIERIYPPENKDLFSKIAERGCILTELLPGTPPRRDFFPTRNRIIVGLSDAVIVVEGKLRTGTWSSASHALKQQRQLFTWTGSPQLELRELPNLLLTRGAIALNRAEPNLVMSTLHLRQK